MMNQAEQELPPAEGFSASAAWELLLGSLNEMFEGFVRHLPNLLIGILVLVLTWTVSWVVRKAYWRLVSNRRLRRSLKDLFSKMISITIWGLGTLAASVVVFPSVKPESILAGLGLSSIAIGFAFKDVVENFIAGFLILIREPLEIGDFVKCNDVEGNVEAITIRDTLVRQTDGQRVIVPNAMLFKNPVWIRTDREERRVQLFCGVAYDVNLDEARSVLEQALEGLQSVHAHREVLVLAHEFGDSSINFEVTWWTGSKPIDVRRSRDEVARAIKLALDQAGIEIPFPHRTLTFKEPLGVEVAGKLPATQESDD